MSKQKPIYRGGGALILATALMGFGFVAQSSASTGHTTLSTAKKKVLIKEKDERYRYTPKKISVARGTKVVWTNKTDVEHNVTVKHGIKINKDIENGKSVSFTFTKPGTYAYHCEYHPYMHGTVVVR